MTLLCKDSSTLLIDTNARVSSVDCLVLLALSSLAASADLDGVKCLDFWRCEAAQTA